MLATPLALDESLFQPLPPPNRPSYPHSICPLLSWSFSETLSLPPPAPTLLVYVFSRRVHTTLPDVFERYTSRWCDNARVCSRDRSRATREYARMDKQPSWMRRRRAISAARRPRRRARIRPRRMSPRLASLYTVERVTSRTRRISSTVG